MNITWKISNIEWIEELDGHNKVVKNVHWWVQAVDENGNMGYTWGNQQLPTDNIDEFIPFETLTEDQVLAWACSQMNVENGVAPDGRVYTDFLEEQAKHMCSQADPLRKRGFGLPW